MLFVKNTLLPNATSRNLPSLTTSEISSEINDAEEDFEIDVNDEENGINVLLFENPGSNSSNEFLAPNQNKIFNKRRIEDTGIDPYLQIEQHKLDLLREEQKKDSALTSNPDYHFLMSLLLYFEQLDTQEKLQLQSDIQDVVIQTLKKKRTQKTMRNDIYSTTNNFVSDTTKYLSVSPKYRARLKHCKS